MNAQQIHQQLHAMKVRFATPIKCRFISKVVYRNNIQSLTRLRASALALPAHMQEARRDFLYRITSLETRFHGYIQNGKAAARQQTKRRGKKSALRNRKLLRGISYAGGVNRGLAMSARRTKNQMAPGAGNEMRLRLLNLLLKQFLPAKTTSPARSF